MPQVLKCPTCSAPLDYPPGGGTTMRCPYCQSTVLLTGDPQANTASTADGAIPDGLRPMIEQALEMAKASGRLNSMSKIEAIKYFRSTSGASLADAKKAIESLNSGRPADFSTRPNPNPAAQMVKIANTGAKIAGAMGLIIAAVVFVIVFAVLHQVRHQVIIANNPVVIPNITIPSIPGITTAPPAPTFAHGVMDFGSEGVGPGKFKDSRAIALDPKGNIYVGEYEDGRVQVFDSQGQFQTMWNLGSDSKIILAMTAARDGTLYVVVTGHILKYDSHGNQIGELAPPTTDPNESLYFMDAYVAPTGLIYGLGQESEICVFNPDGTLKSGFKASDNVGEPLELTRVVTTSTGEIFALDRTKGVFKFAADGRYINRFAAGNIADSNDRDNPALLMSPQNLAVDSQNRIYVSDIGPSIKIFTPQGTFIDSFGDGQVAFGMAITDKDEIFACIRNEHLVRKFVLDKHN